MRTLLASALVLLACGCADHSSRPSGAGATLTIPSGPDAIVLRIPRAGGTVAAYAYPSLDSVLWRSVNRAPALNRVIAFGPEDGYLAAVDTANAPVRIDLRLGTVVRVRNAGLSAFASQDGGAIYAIDSTRAITRFTPSGGDWKAQAATPAAALLPQADGSLIVASAGDERVQVWRVRPPNDTLSDSISVAARGSATQLASVLATTALSVGDRVYVGAGERVMAFSTRDLSLVLNVSVGDPVTALVSTPSGDRVFAALDDESSLRIVDRFEEDVAGRVKLSSPARALRMDPLGRFLLVRGEGRPDGNDAVSVVSLAAGKVLATLETTWRGDLPMVLADGKIAAARGDDVVLLHPESLEELQVITRGARDHWHAMRWNGFRARASGLDAPVEFRTRTDRQRIDTTDTALMVDTIVDTMTTRPRAASPERTMPPARSTRAQTDQQFTVSFAALLNERQARDLAKRIVVDGSAARVTTSDREGRTIYRVILGPFATRAAAERAGRASGYNYWVYEGAP